MRASSWISKGAPLGLLWLASVASAQETAAPAETAAAEERAVVVERGAADGEIAATAEDPNGPARGREVSPADGSVEEKSPPPVVTRELPIPPERDAPAKPAVEESPLPADWTKNFTLGGGAILYYYQPTEGGDANFSLFFANLVLDGKWGIFGLHVEPRFRDTRLRPFFEGPAWVQEAYGSVQLDPVTLKVGKIYKRGSGVFWDNSFYGNVQVYDGLKLDPNYGLSAEGSIGGDFGLDFAAQFFVVDGRTNVSLQNRDTISIPDARRRNTVVGRVEPYLKLGDRGEVRVGLAAEHFQADIPGQEEGVTRLGADAKFKYGFGDAGSLGVWGEYVHQDGRHVLDHPVAGGASGDNHYVLVGAEYSVWRLTARYNLSYGNYVQADTTELLHVPGLGIKVHDQLNLLGEFVVWRQSTAAGEIPYDTSLNVTLHGRF